MANDDKEEFFPHTMTMTPSTRLNILIVLLFIIPWSHEIFSFELKAGPKKS